jgi:hypothetical protein
MNKFRSLFTNNNIQPKTRATALLTFVAVLAGTFWIAASPALLAQKEEDGDGGLCQVCHKNRQTIELACNSLALRRHRAHGDFDGPCPPTTGSREE